MSPTKRNNIALTGFNDQIIDTALFAAEGEVSLTTNSPVESMFIDNENMIRLIAGEEVIIDVDLEDKSVVKVRIRKSELTGDFITSIAD